MEAWNDEIVMVDVMVEEIGGHGMMSRASKQIGKIQDTLIPAQWLGDAHRQEWIEKKRQ